MEKKNKKKGFTLIELLAVIVVLAIVSVLGASIILPALADARKNAFVSEANNFLEAASNGVSLIQVGQITKSDYETAGVTYNDTTKTYCFNLTSLIKLGLFDKKTDSNGVVPDYNGAVQVVASSGSTRWNYTTSFSNKNFYVLKKVGNVTASDVHEYAKDGTYSSVGGKEDCS